MNEYLSFRKMITPVVIQILFWIGVVGCVIAGLVGMIAGNVLGGLMTLVLGPIIVRIYCELIILAFRIYDILTEIRDGKAAGGASVVQPPTGQ